MTLDDTPGGNASRLSSIATKLRALRNVTQENGATEAEALSAAAKYEELLAKYHLDATDLEIREEGTALVKINWGSAVRSNAFNISRYIGPGIAAFTHCKCWHQMGAPIGRGRRADVTDGFACFLGLRSETELAEWLDRSLVAFIQAEGTQFAWSNEGVTQGEVEAFVITCAQRVQTRLREMSQGTSSGAGALVVTRAKMINEAFAALGIQLHASRNVANYTGRGASEGHAAGNRASFARPTGFQPTLKLGHSS